METPSTRPIMRLLDLVGRRWTLRVIWELRGAPLRSRGLRAACDGLSPTVLQSRIDDLRAAGLLELGAEGYALTPLGREFMAAFLPLYAFADRWAQEVPAQGSDTPAS